MLLRDRQKTELLLSEAHEMNLYACLDVERIRHVSLIEDVYWSLWAQISLQPKLFSGVHCCLC